MNSETPFILQSITKESDPLLKLVEKTYVDSFPEEERREFHLVMELLTNEPRFTMFALLNGDMYVGFITSWRFEAFSYVEHFAIDASVRNGGMGGKVMALFLSLVDRPIILEVELPADDMSIRRIGFYERLGFRLFDGFYQQPPYREEGSLIQMNLMSYGDLDMNNSAPDVIRCLHKHVYGYCIIKGKRSQS